MSYAALWSTKFKRPTHSPVIEGNEVHRSPLRTSRRRVLVTTHKNNNE